jgi:hypothetical protein
MQQNPVMPHKLRSFDPHTVAMLNAMEAAYLPLLAAAEQLRVAGQHEKAIVLEVMGEGIVDRLEEITSELEEGGHIEAQRGEIEPGVEEQFAAVWTDYLIWAAGGRALRGEYSYSTPTAIASLLRSIAETYPGFRRETTDDQLVAAAIASHEAMIERTERMFG